MPVCAEFVCLAPALIIDCVETALGSNFTSEVTRSIKSPPQSQGGDQLKRSLSFFLSESDFGRVDVAVG